MGLQEGLSGFIRLHMGFIGVYKGLKGLCEGLIGRPYWV